MDEQQRQFLDALLSSDKVRAKWLLDQHKDETHPLWQVNTLIPYQVAEETLHAISRAVMKWGKYPLDWIENGH